MNYTVRIMKSAQNDMREIYRNITDELCNPIAASRRIALIDEAVQSLKSNPDCFPFMRDEYLSSKGFRVIVIKKHLVFFTIREPEHIVSIMRVLYGRRDWLRLLQTEREDTTETL